MLTVREVSKLAGVSVRTLHHYDQIGLLSPHARSEVGYRLYDQDDLIRLQQILLFRELEFPLARIRQFLDNPDFDPNRALEQQIELLELKREHIDKLIDLARSMKTIGARALNFKAFDTSKLDEYASQAEAKWGNTPQWEEYKQKASGRSKREETVMGEQMLALFVPFGRMAAEGADPACAEAQERVGAIQAFISQNFYACTNEILSQLGRAYGAGGDFTRNINAVAGAGAAEFAAQAVEVYCR